MTSLFGGAENSVCENRGASMATTLDWLGWRRPKEEIEAMASLDHDRSIVVTPSLRRVRERTKKSFYNHVVMD